MAKIVTIGITLLTVLPAVCYFLLNRFGLLKFNPDNLTNYVLFGIFEVLAISVCTFLLFRGRFKNVDPLMYLLVFFGCSSVMGLCLAVEMDGRQPWTPSMFAKNITELFPFLENSHVTAGLYWNGTVLYILAIAMVILYTRRDSHREVGLYWAAGLLNAALVLWPTVLTGKSKVTHTNLVAVKFITHFSLTVLIIGCFLHRRPVQARTFLKFDPIWKRPVDLLFFVYFLWALVTTLCRGLAVGGSTVPFMKNYVKTYEPFLTDPSGFPKTQAITNEYLMVMYYLFTLYGLVCPGQHWMADFSLLHAGASAQGQFSYIAGSLHWRTSKDLRAPLSGQAGVVFWTVNALLFVVPHLFALWCQRDAEKYGRTYTMDLATPVKTYVVTSTRKTVTTRTIRSKDD